MSDSTPPKLFKQCHSREACINSMGCWLPATTEYFHVCRATSDGLQRRCKVCLNEISRRRRSQKLPSDAKKRREYYEKNKERLSLIRKETNRRDRAKIRERERRYYANNKEVFRKREAKAYLKHAEKKKANARRRRSRMLQVVDNFTALDRQRMMDYWNGRCAYCGASADFWLVIAGDHFVALSAGGQTTADNIIPACHGRKGIPDGVVSCNRSKGAQPAEEWLVWRFGKRKAGRILERISTYFEWVKGQSDAYANV